MLVMAVVVVTPTAKTDESVDKIVAVAPVPVVGDATVVSVVVKIVLLVPGTVKVQKVELNSASNSGLQYNDPTPTP